MTYEKQESRYFTRVEVKIDATVKFDDGTSFAATVRDVSMVGVYFLCHQHKDIGKECDVILHLGETPTNEEITVEAKGMVKRLTEEGMAVEFTHLIGDDSYHLLRRIVLRYAEDPTRAEKELNDPHGVFQEEGE